MQFKTKALLASLILASASNAFAATTAELKVTGSIVPAACTPKITGEANYGSLGQANLGGSSATGLATKSVPYTITCNAPTRIGMKFTDSRASSTAEPNTFGLGFQGTETKIGYYTVANDPTKALADGNAATLLTKTGSGDWVAETGSLSVPNTIQSFATNGVSIPVPHTIFAGSLLITSVILPLEGMDLSKEITLDGVATMEVIYL